MSERSYGLESWIDRLDEADLPALAAVVQDLQRLTVEEMASVRQLADVLLRDATLTSKVLRVANSSYYNPSQDTIRTVTRAIVLVGFENIRLISLSVSLIDGLLARTAREQLLELLARSFHAAVQARNLSRYVASKQDEEVFIAALLHHVGELAFWSCGDEQADELAFALAQPGVKPEEAVQAVLGTSFRQLTLGLVKAWNLGELASLSQGGSNLADVGVRSVNLGVRISEAALDGWHSPAMEALVAEVAGFTGVTEADAWQQVLSSADEAVKVAATFGASRLCDLIPRTDPEQIELQRAQRAARLHQGSAQLAQDCLRELGQFANRRGDVATILHILLKGLHQGVGLERVMLAVLTDQQSRLRARSVAGEGTAAWSESFAVTIDEQGDADLFSYVLRHQQPLWMGVPASHSLDELVTPVLREQLGKGMFFIAPIMAGARKIGVLYADSRLSGRALKSEQFTAFHHFCKLAGRSLDRLSRAE